MASSGRRRLGIAVLVAALALTAIGVASVRADPAPNLPSIGGAELLSSSLAALARPFTISGDVDTHFDLGIPQIPSTVSDGTGGGVMGALTLVTGDQRYRVWRSADGVRVAHLLAFSEQDLVVSANDAWFWDSSDMSALHLGGVPGTKPWEAAPSAAAVEDADFLEFARRALDRLAPYADFSVDIASTVAGRPAYAMVLTPTSTLTLIGRIAVAIDAETRLPLRFQVFPSGSDRAAIEAGFSSVSFGPIDPSMFSFTPPRGTTVRQAADVIAEAYGSADGDRTPPVSDVQTFGRGFDLRLALRLDSPLPPEGGAVLPYAGPLLSAITVERGGETWLLLGPVSVATLEQDAASLP